MKSANTTGGSRDDRLPSGRANHNGEEGLATLIAVVALSIFALLGIYMSLNATTELRITDNFESRLQADYAARAGIAHIKDAIRGLDHNALLQGPDGTYSTSASYTATARTLAFRNFLTWQAARSLNILDPTPTVSAIPDDGIVSTGKSGTVNGTPIVPAVGIAVTAPNPYGAGTIVTGRYFLKATDNNGAASELMADPNDRPFVDGDGIIILRSMGVSATMRESGTLARSNSAIVYEIRFKKSTTFQLDTPVVLQGNAIAPSSSNMFNGNSFKVDGGTDNYGIGTIDTDLLNGPPLDGVVRSHVGPSQKDNIKGKGGTPSITDLTTSLTGDQLDLLNAGYMWNFITTDAKSFADNVYIGNQKWSGSSSPDLGYYDITKPENDPVQRPKVTYVDGDLEVSGNMSGAGLLVVRGKLSGTGTFSYTGLVLVIGKGDVNLAGLNLNITGGMYVANLELVSGTPTWGTTKFTMSGNSNFIVNSGSLGMATKTIPPKQLSYREVTSAMDPASE